MILEIAKITLIVYIFYMLTEEEMIFGWYGRLIEKLPNYLYKPLGGCFVCLTGQVLAWYYLIKYFAQWNIIDQLFYPAAGIAISLTYNYLYERA